VTGRALRIVLGLLASVAALAVAACGQHEVTVAETEGIYLDLGELKYQVQISREVNPSDPQDREFFRGLPEGSTPNLPADEIWFAVFLRVENPTDEPQPMADQFEIVDTTETKYTPVLLDPKSNPLVYQARDLPARGRIPEPDSAIDQSFAQGGLLLFKLKTSTNQNRPIVLHITNTQGTYRGEVDLDF
jgi:hypothetical protein